MALICYAGQNRGGARPTHDFNPTKSPRQAEFLSYLQGLKPVGEPIEVPLAWFMEDLGFRTHTAVCNILAKLIGYGYVQRVAVGSRATSGVLIVLKRLEAAS